MQNSIMKVILFKASYGIVFRIPLARLNPSAHFTSTQLLLNNYFIDDKVEFGFKVLSLVKPSIYQNFYYDSLIQLESISLNKAAFLKSRTKRRVAK